MKNKNFLKSFMCASEGFINALKNEYNLRLDLLLMLSVVYFALFYGVSRTEWAVLVVVFSMVIGAELFNTAIENAVDTATEEFNRFAKAAKDTAAAAVFVCAWGAVACAALIFCDIQKWGDTLKVIFSRPATGAVFCILALLDIICLFYRRKGK